MIRAAEAPQPDYELMAEQFGSIGGFALRENIQNLLTTSAAGPVEPFMTSDDLDRLVASVTSAGL